MDAEERFLQKKIGKLQMLHPHETWHFFRIDLTELTLETRAN